MRFVKCTCVIAVLTMMFAASCEHAEPFQAVIPSGPPTLSSIQTAIFNPSCAIPSCHAGGSPPEGLNLSDGQAFTNLVGVQSPKTGVVRVDPGKPDDSYLVWKLEDNPNISGAQMPRNASPLSQAQIDLIRSWIADGAKDN